MQKKYDSEEIQAFNEASKYRRKYREFDDQQKIKLKEFKQIWQIGERIKPYRASYPIIPWLLALTIILFIANQYNKTHHTQSIPNTILPTVTNNTLPLPPTSTISTSYDTASATCPLAIITNDKNYYVKLCDTTKGDQTIAKLFVRAGEKLSIKIPPGVYKIKYGAGDEWYGEKELFGQLSEYGESEFLSFEYDGYSSQGHTVSFYKSVNGNFHTNHIGRDALLQN